MAETLDASGRTSSALRRVAVLVARGAGSDEVFAAVAEEVARLADDEPTTLVRYDGDRTFTVVATVGGPAPVGTSVTLAPDDAGVLAAILRTGRPARVDDYAETRGPSFARDDYRLRSSIGVPVFAHDRLWGVFGVTTSRERFSDAAGARVEEFGELVAAALTGAQAREDLQRLADEQAALRAQLAASRARVIAEADAARRRVQRDVHEGAQQRLMQSVINLKLARAEAGADSPLRGYLEEALVHAEAAAFELRQLVHEILPASLSRAGLRAGLESLVAGLDLPVRLAADVPRLPAQIETTAYLVVAEALANAARHAAATSASVDVTLSDSELTIAVADDGRGGAAPAAAPWLTGLLDRVEAGDGTLDIAGPTDAGTVLTVTLPLGGWTA